MNSSIDATWKKPIQFSPEFARKLSDLADVLTRRLVAHIVTDAGKSAAEICSSDQAEAAYIASDRTDYGFHQLAGTLREVEVVAWSAKLRDETDVQGLTVTQLLGLSNVGRQQINSVKFENSSYSYRIGISFNNNKYINGMEIKLNGPLELVQQARSEIEALLSANAQPWWFMRDVRFFWATFAILALIMNLVHPIASALSWEPNITVSRALLGGVILPIIGILAALIFPISLMLFGGWNWLFPMSDFVFGAGEKRSEMRKNFRSALWVIPVLLLAFPVLANLMTDEIAK